MLQNRSDGNRDNADGTIGVNGRRLRSRVGALGIAATIAAIGLGVPLHAANPHVVSADSTTGVPVFLSPGNLHWDTGLTVPFKIAGLGNNPGLDVKLNAKLSLAVTLRATTTRNTLVANQGFTSPSGGNVNLTATSDNPGSYAITLDFFQVNPTLTSDKNGQVSGTLEIPGVITAAIPDNLTCIKLSWTHVTLTFNGQAVALPDVTRQFDSTGSFCN